MREHVPQVAPFLRLGGREWFLPQAMRALNHRAYRLFWIGQLVSLTGSWMQSAAQQWLVYRLTGSSLKLGVVMMAATLPVTLLAPIAGVLIDRADKRKLLIRLQACMMLLAVALATLTATGVIRFAHVVVLASLLGCVNAFDMPTRQAFTADMVVREDLMSAIALNSSIFNGARLFGPAVAGLLVAHLGEAPAFAINALSYLAVIAALLAMDMPRVPLAREPKHPWVEMREGAAYLLRDGHSLSLVVMVGIACTLTFPFTTLVPVIAVERLGLHADGFGMLISSFGLGALVGASMLAALSAERDAGRMLVAARVVSSLAIAGVAVSRSVPLTCLAMAVAGWALITHLATSNTLIQLRVPDELRGRVMSFYTWCAVGTAPLGALFMGGVAERLGAPAALLLGSATCLILMTLVPLVLRLRSAPAVESRA
jgi:MFS family permease